MLAARDDPEADVGQALRDAQEQREVAMRVGADRDDVDRPAWLRRTGAEGLGVDAERDEHDSRGEAVRRRASSGARPPRTGCTRPRDAQEPSADAYRRRIRSERSWSRRSGSPIAT